MLAAFSKLIGDLLGFVQPFALQNIIQYVEEVFKGVDTDVGGVGYGVYWAIGMFLASFMQQTCLQRHHHLAIRSGMNARCATQDLVYKKTMKLSPAGQSQAGAGEVQTLQSNDSVKIM